MRTRGMKWRVATRHGVFLTRHVQGSLSRVPNLVQPSKVCHQEKKMKLSSAHSIMELRLNYDQMETYLWDRVCSALHFPFPGFPYTGLGQMKLNFSWKLTIWLGEGKVTYEFW